ncbi:MAG TPA: FAD/NAD(P)-binding oxidoreductase [Candidatus Acidoferrales bacterium]|nr:FAD/NAD(P)-binding oxidoreductase [Candidatus Acidoferrales bacterium]
MAENNRHKTLIIGGGTAGLIVAARLVRAGESDVAIIEPSETHFYQPLWTLVGAGAVRKEATTRAERSYIPAGVTWFKDWACEVSPESNYVATRSGARIAYDFLIVAPGLELNWDAIAGLREAVGNGSVSTNYTYENAPQTWDLIRNFKGGTALFHMPGTPIKCPGAPQKIMYLAADHFRRNKISANVIYGSATPTIYGVKEYAAVLDTVVKRYGIDARFSHDLVEVRGDKKEAVFVKKDDPAGARVTIGYDIMHVAPPQIAPEFIRNSPLPAQGQPGLGWVEVDQYTLQHKRYPNVFALGDVAGSPNAKTGAAALKQAPVVVSNLLAVMRGAMPVARYYGYVACPITTAYGKLLLCEFDYTGKPTPTIPFINTVAERYDTWLLKRYGLPWLYWHLMLRGRDVPFLGALAAGRPDASTPAELEPGRAK